MKKFPVISASGNEYLVEIYFRRYYRVVTLKKKRKYLWNKYLYSNRHIPDKRDFVEIAKDAVYKYEEQLESDRQYLSRIEKSKKQFEEWDGKC